MVCNYHQYTVSHFFFGDVVSVPLPLSLISLSEFVVAQRLYRIPSPPKNCLDPWPYFKCLHCRAVASKSHILSIRVLSLHFLGWHDVQYKYWCLSIYFTYKSVSILPFSLTSRCLIKFETQLFLEAFQC